MLPIRRLKNPRILKSQIKRDEHVCAHVLTLISIKQALARMILNRQEIDISIVTALLRNCLAQVFFKEYPYFFLQSKRLRLKVKRNDSRV